MRVLIGRNKAWISARDHSYCTDSEDHSMIYGETYNGWCFWVNNHQGANVWVR